MDQIFEVTTKVSPQIYQKLTRNICWKNKLNYLRLFCHVFFSCALFPTLFAFFDFGLLPSVTLSCVPIVFFFVSKRARNRNLVNETIDIFRKVYGTNTPIMHYSFCAEGIFDLSASQPEFIDYIHLSSVIDAGEYMLIVVVDQKVPTLVIRKAELHEQIESLNDFLQSKILEQLP